MLFLIYNLVTCNRSIINNAFIYNKLKMKSDNWKDKLHVINKKSIRWE